MVIKTILAKVCIIKAMKRALLSKILHFRQLRVVQWEDSLCRETATLEGFEQEQRLVLAKLLNWPFMLLLEQAQGTKREITIFLRFLLYLKKPSDLKIEFHP